MIQFQRDITRVWNVQYRKNSPTHTVGLLLEPGSWEEYDPFLLLAEDWFQKGTFAAHPHRGIETVTYVIEGKLDHYDNKAGDGELFPGDVQWMTAGRGVIHSEDPAPGETVHSLQLWLNLPQKLKMTEPRYQNLRGQDMPVREEEGVSVRVFSGSSANVTAPTENHVPVTMVELNVEAGASITQNIPGEYNGFIYVLEGSAVFGRTGTAAEKGQVLWLGAAQAGKESGVHVHAHNRLRALLYAGRPIGEKVVAKGPFVMNSEEEIRQAYKDYTDGKFG